VRLEIGVPDEGQGPRIEGIAGSRGGRQRLTPVRDLVILEPTPLDLRIHGDLVHGQFIRPQEAGFVGEILDRRERDARGPVVQQFLAFRHEGRTGRTGQKQVGHTLGGWHWWAMGRRGRGINPFPNGDKRGERR
jgi:hypothetical protein